MNKFRIFNESLIVWKYFDKFCFNYIWPYLTYLTHSTFTSLVSFWCLYCQLWTNFTYCSSVFNVDFQQVNGGWGVEVYLGPFQTSMMFFAKIILSYMLNTVRNLPLDSINKSIKAKSQNWKEIHSLEGCYSPSFSCIHLFT